MADTGEIAGFVVLSLVILAILVGVAIAVWLFIRKLKQQNEDITNLQQKLEEIEKGLENGVDNVGFESLSVRKNNVGGSKHDSAVDLGDNASFNTDRQSSIQTHEPTEPRFMTTKPRYTMMIDKQLANVYCQELQASQVVALAQNFHGIGERTVPVDDIHVNSSSRQDDRVVKSLSKLILGRPTSILMDTIATTDKVIHEQGMFVHKSVGPGGDTLTISGITLEIPPGALKESKMITLGEIWNIEYLPKLPKNKARLSPVVACLPCIKFAVPVKLTFPHCAHNTISDWTPKIMKRQGDIKDNVDWEDITLADYDERSVTASQVSVHLKHFTLYTLVGESKQDKQAAKKVKLVAYSEPFTLGSLFKTRIYCVNDYDEEIQEVKKYEKGLSGRQNNAPVPLLFHDNGENLTVAVAELMADWNVVGSKIEEMDFESVWHALTPYSNFVFQESSKDIKLIHCEFKSYQNHNEQRKVTLKVSDEVRVKSNILSVTGDSSVRRQLIILLDPKSDLSDAGDYRSLADKMGLNTSEIHYLESQPNPTEILLERWDSMENNSMDKLHKLLLEINRPDAAEEVSKLLKT